jgi:hypothetical protein
MEEGRVSPITQRMASNKFDLPQPLGPITAVRPDSMKSSVGSTKDLKPESLSRVNFKKYAPPYASEYAPAANYFFLAIAASRTLANCS